MAKLVTVNFIGKILESLTNGSFGLSSDLNFFKPLVWFGNFWFDSVGFFFGHTVNPTKDFV